MADTTWTQTAGMVSDEDTDNLENYAEQAEASKDAAAASETAAATSATAAAGSATAAAGSSSAASTSATAANASASSAASSATAASGSASAAAASATAASGSETAAAASEAAAATSATNAATSATSASGSASSASMDASAASTSATAAATSATAAAASETAAAASETAAAASETAAAASETAASASETAAAASETAAAASETAASASETAAATSATAAATSATNAATSETNALSYVADSESARDQSQAARDTANLHKLAAEAAATSATNTASALTGFDLEAIAASKGVTAVDVFVYDTSKDSDGGAWRKRTQGTSWYNETLNTATRGSRREFPAVAVIVAESNKVTIYDGDDPALPMWMVFDQTQSENYFRLGGGVYAITGLSALNGILSVSFSGASGYRNALTVVNFSADKGANYSSSQSKTFNGTISQRNAANSGLGETIFNTLIVRYIVNDVAMTVLPDAPIDPATGLPVPTIAVATAGGVSVIKDDGTVVDISKTSGGNSWDVVSFTEQDQLKMHSNSISVTWLLDIPNADIGSGGAGGPAEVSSFTATSLTVSGTKLPRYLGYSSLGSSLPNNWGSSSGLTFHSRNAADEDQGMVAYTTSTYNTGWMNGDIKGAFLSDTDDTDLVGSGELVTNGTFDTDLTGWTAGGGSITFSAGTLVATTVDVNDAFAWQVATTVIGKTYVWSVDAAVISGSPAAAFRIGTAAGGFQIGQVTVSAGGSFSGTFVAVGTSTYLSLVNVDNVGSAISFDNVSVKLADADRSVNNKGLIVNGTVTRTPVATGADLVAYSGFSAANYLQGLGHEISTGDFSVICWFYKDSTASQNIVTFVDSDLSSEASPLFSSSNGNLLPVFPGVIDTGIPIPLNAWSLLEVSRSGGILSASVNGVRGYSASNTFDASTVPEFFVGVNRTFGLPNQGSLALLRISATAPTAEAIKKIYNDEKVLFQENAGAVLAGTSDAVTSLAYDDVTQELLVGTSQNTSVFRGLRRVEAISGSASAISASNGLRVIED